MRDVERGNTPESIRLQIDSVSIDIIGRAIDDDLISEGHILSNRFSAARIDVLLPEPKNLAEMERRSTLS